MSGVHMLVLAGGFGTRLRAVVADVPKPLAPIGARPFLHYQLDHWIAQGVTRITLLLHHHAHLIEQFLVEFRRMLTVPCEIQTVTEPRPLGTGGSIAHAVRRIGIEGPFLVTNSDTWLGSGLSRTASARAPAVAVVRVADSERYGAVRLADEGRIAEFCEKRDSAGPGWINAGLYQLHDRDFADWDGEPFSLERDLFPQMAQAGRLAAVPLQVDFIDIGIPQDYFRFCRWIESERVGAP